MKIKSKNENKSWMRMKCVSENKMCDWEKNVWMKIKCVNENKMCEWK